MFTTGTLRSVIFSQSTSSLLSLLIISLSYILSFPVFSDWSIKLCMRLDLTPWHLQHKPQILSKNGVGTTQCSISSNHRQEKRSKYSTVCASSNNNIFMKGILVIISYLHACQEFGITNNLTSVFSENCTICFTSMSSYTVKVFLQNIFVLFTNSPKCHRFLCTKNKQTLFTLNYFYGMDLLASKYSQL